MKKDAGLTNPNGIVTLNLMKALMSMNSFKLLDAWSTWLNEGKGSEKYNPFADLNNDGFINGKDFAMLLREFNNKTSDDINKIIEEAENRNEQ